MCDVRFGLPDRAAPPDRRSDRRVDGAGVGSDLFAPEAIFAWMAILGILSFVVLTAKRRKRCCACGHEWVN